MSRSQITDFIEFIELCDYCSPCHNQIFNVKEEERTKKMGLFTNFVLHYHKKVSVRKCVNE